MTCMGNSAVLPLLPVLPTLAQSLVTRATADQSRPTGATYPALNEEGPHWSSEGAFDGPRRQDFAFQSFNFDLS
jgi:hypothetical protein